MDRALSTHYLRHFFNPRGVAIFGASEGTGSPGEHLLRNLREGGYRGGIYPINPRRKQVQGLPCYGRLSVAPEGPIDLAVLAVPDRALEASLRACAARGVRAVILPRRLQTQPRHALEKSLLKIAREANIRLLGPDSIGLLRPGSQLNLSCSRNSALPGKLALVAQSNALCTTILDWAQARGIGFSTVVALGDTLDVATGDLLDFLATDPATTSVLLYLEGIHDSRRFMSGLRAASRLKPVIVVKAGRHAEGSRAVISHTGALVGADDVFAAALSRAGAVRADSIDQLFAAAQILSSGYRLGNNRLAVITNGGGPGIIATDRAVDLGVAMPPLSPQTQGALPRLPAQSTYANPLDLGADADAEAYRSSAAACLQDPNIDGVLALVAPQANTEPAPIAQALLELGAGARKPILACWLGDARTSEARQLLAGTRIPGFRTPEAAVEAFAYLADYQRSQQLLMQVPGPRIGEHDGNPGAARRIAESALAEGRSLLTSMESKALLAAYDIPVVPTVEAHSLEQALEQAEALGYPLAMKISSPDISHKTSIGGVRLNITSAAAVRSAFEELLANARLARPHAKLHGVTLEPMHGKPHGRELMIGVLRDPVFGPVISFGAGGVMVELIRDRSVALPPLNPFIAHDLIGRTRVSRALASYHNMPPAHIEHLVQVLLRVSDMVCSLPHVREMDINPVVVDENGVVAVDARFRVDFPPSGDDPYDHMAIHPYPVRLRYELPLADGDRCLVRAIRPEDATEVQEFVNRLSPEARYFRYMEALQQLTPTMLVRFTQIDYFREMALVAVRRDGDHEQLLAVARYVTNPDGESCEFALVVTDAWQGKGIGTGLMQRLIEFAASRGLVRMEGEVLAKNAKMLGLMRRLGFSIRPDPEDFTLMKVIKPLSAER